MVSNDIRNEVGIMNYTLKNIENLLCKVIKLISTELNQNNVPNAWLDPADRELAERYRQENPELYDYIIKMFCLYLSGNNETDNGDK